MVKRQEKNQVSPQLDQAMETQILLVHALPPVISADRKSFSNNNSE